MLRSISTAVMGVHCDVCDVHIAAESLLEQHINGRRHQFMLVQLRQRLCAWRSVFVRGFLFNTTVSELSNLFQPFGSVSKVILNQSKGLFAIIEFENEESAQNALSHDEDILLRGRRLVVKPRRVKQQVAAPSDNDDDQSAEPSAENLHIQLLSKLSSCCNIEEQFELLVHELELTADDHTVRTKICRQLETLLRPTFSDCSVCQFGSSANNLGIRGCDMDLFLHITDADTDVENNSVKEQAAVIIKQIAGVLRHSTDFTKVLPLPRARCPVVKFVHTPSGINCDMSVNNRLAERNTKLLRFLTSIDVRIHRLMHTVRYWAKLRRVSASGGRLTSYALTLLVIYYLQSVGDPLIPSIDRMSQLAEEKCVIDGWDSSFTTDLTLMQHNNSMSTAELLAGFFQFYAQFNLRAYIVCPRLGHAVDVAAFIDRQQTDPKVRHFKVTVLSVQDPFVLDHNTTSNISERLRCDITREFQRADDHCRNLIGCGDRVEAEHAGIVKLLSDSTSSVGSPAASLQLALSPQLTTDDNVVRTDVPEESARIQLFVLRFQDLAEPATVATTVLGHRSAELEHRVSEPEHRVGDDVGTVSRYGDVVGIVKLMLADIFDVECISRDQPSEQFDIQLSQLLTVKADHDSNDPVQSKQKVCNLTMNSLPPSATSYMADDNQLPPDRKRPLPEDSGDTDGDSDTGNDKSDHDSSLHHSRMTAAKRPRSSDRTSESNVRVIIDSEQPNVPNTGRHILLSVHCSARSRLWVGRKKIRRQFLHFSDELKRQLEVSSALRKEITKSEDAILDFELAVVHRLDESDAELMIAVLPTKKTGKEFGCFVTFFISLVQKLVNNITIEGPLHLTA